MDYRLSVVFYTIDRQTPHPKDRLGTARKSQIRNLIFVDYIFNYDQSVFPGLSQEKISRRGFKINIIKQGVALQFISIGN
jgi:hypothetical protein